MLVLGAKHDSRFYIDVPSDKPQRIVVVQIADVKSRLGFEADNAVRIIRAELEQEPKGEAA